MNKVILIGRLAKDPELRTTPNNLSVATFTIAISRSYRPQNGGAPETDFINCVVWRAQAENLVKYCRKGSQIAVDGQIQTRNYTTQDGSRRYITEVLCDSITFLGSKNDNQSNAGGFGNSYPAPQEAPSYQMPTSNDTPIDNYNPEVSTTDISDDPFKDFGEEITLSDDDLPF